MEPETKGLWWICVGVLISMFIGSCALKEIEKRDKEGRNPIRQYNPSQLCINGVLYYGIDRAAVPAYNKDGKLITC